MIRRCLAVLLMLAGLAPLVVKAAGKVQVDVSGQPRILVDGKPARAIGVNYYNGFMRVLRNPEDRGYREGFRLLGERKIPFVRFVLMGFFPTDMRLYLRNRERFYQLLDDFIAEAQKNGVGVVPSLFFAYWQVPDQMGEPMQAWGDPASKSNAFMRQFVTELVTRYRDSPAIWGWEFSNEMAYYVDLDAKARPRLAPDKGTPSQRTERDDLRADDMVCALKAFGTLVRELDPQRLVSSGNAMPRPDAYQKSYRTGERIDSTLEFAQILKRDNPLPLNAISVHTYPHTRYFRDKLEVGHYWPKPHNIQEQLKIVHKVADEQKQVVFLGEFGVASRKAMTEDEERRVFKEMIEGIVASGVQLAAIWDFDPDPDFDKDMNIYFPRRRYQLDAVQDANRQLSNE